jgi:rRNA maturation endonuclease Nob1
MFANVIQLVAVAKLITKHYKMKRIVNINGKTKEEVLINKLEIENIDLKRQITELEQALQLQQIGVSTCFLQDVTDDVFNIGYKQVSCCKIAPIINENYCPKCGKKILK